VTVNPSYFGFGLCLTPHEDEGLEKSITHERKEQDCLPAESHMWTSNDLINGIKSLEQELQQQRRHRIAAEERARKMAEVHKSNMKEQAALIQSLQKDKEALSAQIKCKLKSDFIDDTALEKSMQDIFHLLQTWCFSNFKDIQSSVQRPAMQSKICQILTNDIISPLVTGISQDTSRVLATLHSHIYTSG
jgi:uncharacterized membrane-anchored protein YjiN (DUF445 family)